MLYESAEAWRAAPRKRIMLYGMSGLGKTHIAKMLRAGGEWFHYSIDYRIGTRYLGERITDNAKAEAMKVPFLRKLLMSDSIYIGSNITFENLQPVATYLGMPGDPGKEGLAIDDYRARQEEFRKAEIAALFDTAYFAERSETLYGYPNFICDTGGSLCEWVDPEDPEDPLMTALCALCLPIWIKGDAAHKDALIARFEEDPKPMAYQPAFLDATWQAYLQMTGQSAAAVDPNAFACWAYARALAHRQPRYEAMSRHGVTVTADEVGAIKTGAEFVDLISRAIERR